MTFTSRHAVTLCCQSIQNFDNFWKKVCSNSFDCFIIVISRDLAVMTKSSGSLCVKNKAWSQRRTKPETTHTRPWNGTIALSRSVCACICVDLCVKTSRQCQGSVTITDCGPAIVALLRRSWHRLRWPSPVCVSQCYGCTNVCPGLVRSAMALPTACVSTGVTYCHVCVCVSCAAGRESPCVGCAREFEGTPCSFMLGNFVSLWERPIKISWAGVSNQLDF